MLDYKFYSRPEYFRALAEGIRKTKRGDRVIVATMNINAAEPLITDLLEALCAAAQKGAEVDLCVDAFTFLWSGGPGPLWTHKRLSADLKPPFGPTFAALQKLAAAGGHYAITNVPRHKLGVPQSGRSHIKGAVINGKVYIGGNNLELTEHTDLMVSFSDTKTCDWLFKQFKKMATVQNTRVAFNDQDQAFSVDSDTRIFIDAGVRNQSIILDNALQLIDEAEEWIVLTCQFFPGGKTAQHLLAAHRRGVDVRILFSHPSAHGKEAAFHHLYNFRERLRLPKRFFANRRAKTAPTLHAKLLATDTGTMLGSHNFVAQGVSLGTAEIALLTRDAEFSKRAVTYLTKLI